MIAETRFLVKFNLVGTERSLHRTVFGTQYNDLINELGNNIYTLHSLPTQAGPNFELKRLSRSVNILLIFSRDPHFLVRALSASTYTSRRRILQDEAHHRLL